MKARPEAIRRAIRRILIPAFAAAVLGVLGLAGCAGEAEREDGYDVPSPMVDDDKDPFTLAPDRPPSASTLRAMARILASQGKTEQAQFVLMRVVREYTDYTPAYSELAELYMRGGRIDDAIETLALGLKLAPKDPVLQNNLGMCWMVVGQYENALKCFTAAASLVPEDARYRSNMATALAMLKRYDEAVVLYEQVVPAYDAHYNLAVVCEAAGDEEGAKREFGIAEKLEDDPEDASLHPHPGAR
jgi:Flp pilus assembly protein TadD